MQLLYLWVKDYKNLRNVGIPFSSEFEFKEEINEDGELERIFITKNPLFVPNFFGLDNLTSVTLLVGKNGSGKTSVAELLRTILAEGDRIIYHEMVVVLRQPGPDRLIHVHKASNLPISVESDLFQIQSHVYEITPLGNQAPRIEIQNTPTIIHYSNTLSFQAPAEYSGVIDETTTGLLETDVNPLNSGPDLAISQTLAHVNAELQRNISFLYGTGIQSHRESIDFELPFELSISPAVRTQADFQAVLKKNGEQERLIELLTSMWQPNQNDNKKSLFRSIFLAVIYSWLSTNQPVDWKLLANRLRAEIEKRSEPVGSYRAAFERLLNAQTALSQMRRSFITAVVQLVGTIEHAIDAEEIRMQPGLDRQSPMLIVDDRSPSGRGILEKIVFHHNEASMVIPVLDFRWLNKAKGESVYRRLSGGEQARLSFFSRMNDAKSRMNGPEKRVGQDLNSEVLLLIDEGDTYYHPEWQRKFFTDVMKAVQWFFRHNLVQLIMTTNAPFIVSDLPHWCVVYLEQDEDGGTRAKRPNEKELDGRTFGQNIHTLLATAFFMKYTIGEFSRRKIDDLIRSLGPTGETDVSEAMKVIDLIGEPVLRMKLYEMASGKFGPTAEIEILEKRIEELKRKKSNDSNK